MYIFLKMPSLFSINFSIFSNLSCKKKISKKKPSSKNKSKPKKNPIENKDDNEDETVNDDNEENNYTTKKTGKKYNKEDNAEEEDNNEDDDDVIDSGDGDNEEDDNEDDENFNNKKKRRKSSQKKTKTTKIGKSRINKEYTQKPNTPEYAQKPNTSENQKITIEQNTNQTNTTPTGQSDTNIELNTDTALKNQTIENNQTTETQTNIEEVKPQEIEVIIEPNITSSDFKIDLDTLKLAIIVYGSTFICMDGFPLLKLIPYYEYLYLLIAVSYSVYISNIFHYNTIFIVSVVFIFVSILLSFIKSASENRIKISAINGSKNIVHFIGLLILLYRCKIAITMITFIAAVAISIVMTHSLYIYSLFIRNAKTNLMY